MTDNQSILSQRFIESEGELGRSFTRVLNKFGELQRAITQTAAGANADVANSSSDTATPAATPSAPTADDVYQQLLRDLSTFEYALSHARTVQSNSLHELGNYDRQEAATASRIAATVSSLVDLQRELDAAKQWRAEQEEYEVIAAALEALPTRATTEAELARLAANHADLLAQQSSLQHELARKRRQHLLVTRTFNTLQAEWRADELTESSATKEQRLAALAAAEAERRRAEEEAAAYEEATKAKAEHAEEAEEGEESDEQKKKDDAGLGGGEGEGEGEGGEAEGAGGEGADGEEPEEGAIEAATPHSNANDEEGAVTATTDAGMADASDTAAAAASSAGGDSPAGSPINAGVDADAAPMET